MTTVDRSLVGKLPLFAGLSAGELDDILREARAVHYPKNCVVFYEDGEADSFFVLLHGYIRASKTTPDGQHVVVRYVSPGEVFGVAMAMGMTRYPATAAAVDDSVALAWPATIWPRLVEKFPVLATNALRTVGSRLQETHARVVEMSTEQVERRVVHALLRLVERAGRKVEAGIEVDFPITRQDIAEMTGTTLHTVSRIISAWEAQGLVKGGRQRIVICDLQKLSTLGES